MKTSSLYIIGFFLAILPCFSSAQNNLFWEVPTSIQADSLKKVLVSSTNDTLNMYLNRQIGMHYQERNRPVALAYYNEMLMLAKKVNQQLWEAEAHSRVGYVSCLMQNYAGGLKSLLLAKTMASDPRAEKGMWNPGLLSQKSDPYAVRMTVMADIYQHFGIVHYFTGEYSKTLGYNQEVKKINEILKDDALSMTYYLNIAESLLELDQLDSAEFALNKSLYFSDKSGFKKYKGLVLFDIGRIKEKRQNFEEAKKYYRLSIETNIEEDSPDFEGMGYQALSNLSQQSGNIDSVFLYSRKALNTYLNINDTLGLIAAYASLSSAFDALNITDSAYHYLKESIALKDGLNKEERIKSFLLTGLNEQFKLQELVAEQLRIKTNIRTYSFVTGIVFLLFISGVFYRNYRRQKKDRHTIEKALANLKSTQSQLVQQEKLASLGQLTAGIAHEIKNPLNFVNNFSEVSIELIEEALEEIVKTQHAASPIELDNGLNEIIAILDDVQSNLSKIHEHGTRANNIVSSMLQHSRGGSGKKEPTDLNALIREYVNLGFHGMRAGKNPIDVSIQLDLDDSIGNVPLIVEDFSRVILNICNNAFDAMRTVDTQNFAYLPGVKSKSESINYTPKLTIRTKKSGDAITIEIEDNGPGIPDDIKDKILQPFFTTKKGTEGTGLGLSITHDIIKAHGGQINIESNENEGSKFSILLDV